MTDETDPFRLPSVPLDEKQERVNEVFHSVAGRYDLMNDLMSAGPHRAVEGRAGHGEAAARPAVPPSRRRGRHRRCRLPHPRGRRAADRGDRARYQRRDARCRPERAAERGHGGRIDFVEANAEALPFDDGALRRLYDRLRHPQRAAHRRGPCGGLSRAEARRPLPVPRFSKRRLPALDRDLRRLFFNVIPRSAGW